jgi:hypothetical protein
MATTMMTRKVSAAGAFASKRSCARMAPLRAATEDGADAPRPSGSTVFFAGKVSSSVSITPL